MRILTSQLAGAGRNADRVLVTDDAVLVLDGASAFEPVPVDPGEYAETLGQTVVRCLHLDPEVAIPDAVACGIRSTARALGLQPGYSPSSTIAILRVRDQLADLYVLGDSPIYYGNPSATHVLRDERLSQVAKTERDAYVDALKAGKGYTLGHRNALAVLQRAQRRHRNRAAGYWIAEAEPDAAHHGLTATVEPSSADWAILGTDGAMDMIGMINPGQWPAIARFSQAQLDELLEYVHRWERDADPSGQKLPRAKRHDDKTLAVIPEVFPS